MEKSEYNSLYEWKKIDPEAFILAKNRNLLDKICNIYGWNIKKHKPDGYWTLEQCKKDALKYKTRSEWSKNSPGYQVANKNGWLDDCCKHMQGRKRYLLSYDAAKGYIKKVSIIKSMKPNDYRKWYKKNLITCLPFDPEVYYKNKGWISWADFLGIKKINGKFYI